MPVPRRSVFVAALTSLVLALRHRVRGAGVPGRPGGRLRATASSPAAASGSVWTAGPFYFAGTNTYDVFTFGFDWLPGEQYVDKPRIDAHMARLQADGVTVLRLWMFSHEDWQGFEAQEGVYTEEEFILFDYVMKSARDHYVRLIPVFENYWEAYGGIDKRLPWEGLPARAGQPLALLQPARSARAASPSTRTTCSTRCRARTSSPASAGSTTRRCWPGSS